MNVGALFSSSGMLTGRRLPKVFIYETPVLEGHFPAEFS